MGNQNYVQSKCCRKSGWLPLLLVHVLPVLLIYITMFVPNRRTTVRSYDAMLAAIAVMEVLFLFQYIRCLRRGGCTTGPLDIVTFIWIFMIIWELCTSVYNIAHPVLVPCPENVFDTFVGQRRIMCLNVVYSMELLVIGYISGLFLAVVLGMIAGWIPRIRDFAVPIANIMAPIPAIVISPYLVSLMPTFRSASLAVIILGVFWPNFLSTMIRIQNIEPQILDSARMLQPDTWTMITRILFPYLLPGIVSGLRVSLTTSLLMLNFAELMGASHGMGYFVQNSITYANYTHAVAGIICIGIVVTVLNMLVVKVQKTAIRWY